MHFKKYIRIYGIIAVFLPLNAATSCNRLETIQFLEVRPNIIIVLTDDMDLSLMYNLRNINALIGQEGATFTNFFVTSPVCCPSRVSLLRGQYPHNTQILSNSPPDGGFESFFLNDGEAATLAIWLNRVGYSTALIGKYLNGYPMKNKENYIPPGWTDWHVFLYQFPGENEESNYFNYPMNENGEVIQYGDSPDDYSTDVIGEKSIDFINRSIVAHSPFFLVISVYAPHGPSIPAPRHAALFPQLTYPLGPSFNEDDVSDKPSWIRSLPLNGDETDVSDADRLYIRRTRAMQAVDELVEDVVYNLELRGQLNNTYIFFTSDNGFHIGEHGLSPGKATPYEEDIHVPFMIRGPGIQSKITLSQLASTIDIAPTIIELAGIETINFMDGRSLVPLLKPRKELDLEWRKGILIEMGTMETSNSTLAPQRSLKTSAVEHPILEFPDFDQGNYSTQINVAAFRGIRTEKFMYVEHKSGEIEYYDLMTDPYELNNTSSQIAPETLSSLHYWLEKLQRCAAETCRKIDRALPVHLSVNN